MININIKLMDPMNISITVINDNGVTFKKFGTDEKTN